MLYASVAKIERGEIPPPKPEGEATTSATGSGGGGGTGNASEGTTGEAAASAAKSSSGSGSQRPKARLDKVGGSRASLFDQCGGLRDLLARQKRAKVCCFSSTFKMLCRSYLRHGTIALPLARFQLRKRASESIYSIAFIS